MSAIFFPGLFVILFLIFLIIYGGFGVEFLDWVFGLGISTLMKTSFLTVDCVSNHKSE